MKNGAIQPGLRGYQPCCPAQQEAPLIIDIGILAFFANLVLGERVWQGEIHYGQDLTPTNDSWEKVKFICQCSSSRSSSDYIPGTNAGIPRKVKKPPNQP